MSSRLSRRKLLKYTRNSLYTLPFAPALLTSVASTAHAAATQKQRYLWRNVVTGGGGGFVVNTIFNHKKQDLVYARTDIGGAYRWDPKTSTWIQLLGWVGADQWNMTGVESIATDSVEPHRLYIAAGTYTNSWTSMNGVILRSDDSGKTFKQTPMPFKMGGNMPGRGMGERLAVDPNKNSILYFGARSGNGLWRSRDKGQTWSQVTNFPATGPFAENPADTSGYSSDPIGIVWVTFDPATGKQDKATKTIYVGVADNRSGASNIFRSTDAGVTWEAIPGQPISTVTGTTVNVTGGVTWDLTKNATTGFLPHQGKLDSEGTLYITYSDWEGPFNGGHGDVWKFVPGTSTWTKISPVAGSDSNNFFGYGGLGIDMQHPGTLVVAPVNIWWPDAQLYRTTDGGATWKTIWEWGSYPNRTLHYTLDASGAPWLDFGNPVAAPPVPAIKVGWMIEGLNIDPFNSDRLLYGTGATLFEASNLAGWDSGGQVAIKTNALGIEEMAVTELVSPHAGAQLLSGVGDVEGFRHDDLTKTPADMYANPRWGAVSAIDYAAQNPLFVVRTGADGGSVIHSAFSTDGGSTWSPAAVDPAGFTGGGISMVAVAADASRVVWSTSGSAGVCFSTDNGASWMSAMGIPKGALVVADRVNAQVFYGFLNGTFYKSSDGGVTFAATGAMGLPMVGSTNTKLVKAMHGHEGDIWLASGSSGSSTGGLWHSTDGGMTFMQMMNVTRAYTIGFGKAAPGSQYMALYITGIIGAITGIFRSDDAGMTWVRVNDDQHQYGSINSAITGDPRVYGRVYVGTNGMGIVYGDIK